MKIAVLVILSLLVFSAFGCKSVKEKWPVTGVEDKTVTEDAGVESDIDSLEILSTDLDTSELDALDKELADITW